MCRRHINMQYRINFHQEEKTMVFADYVEFETAKSQLKTELKTRVANAFDNIFEQCYYHIYDIWGFVLDVTKPAFLKFTKGHKEEWCDKISLLFETAFVSVATVVYERTKTINMKTCTFILTTSLITMSCSMKSGLCARNASKL